MPTYWVCVEKTERTQLTFVVDADDEQGASGRAEELATAAAVSPHATLDDNDKKLTWKDAMIKSFRIETVDVDPSPQ
jgi:hypothetical protein